MRLLFFSSSLEPGRDGVGDYVRLLAEACARQGHRCAILALHDSFVTGPTDSTLTGESGEIPMLRLPSTMTWPQRIERATAFRTRFQPEWISFHLVPYAFDRMGLLAGLVPTFRALTAGLPLHLMFHELWLGAGRPTPFRSRVIGQLQRFGIRRLLSRLRPQLVTTSNPVYAAMLRSLHTDAVVLPLFGNVPVVKASALSQVAETGITEKNRDQWWVGIFFGALHEQWKPEPFMGLLLRGARHAGKRVALLSVGRMGSQGEEIWNRLQSTYGPEVLFLNRAEQPAGAISALLQFADFGVAASPWQLIGKSGTVAAMLDHGLPVIVTRDDFQPFFQADGPPSTDPLIHRCEDNLEAKLIAGLSRRPAQARVDEIAGQLGARLQTLSPLAS